MQWGRPWARGLRTRPAACRGPQLWSAGVRFGVHLPQYGRAAGADAIARVAQHAEELGFSDVWVSDHLAVPTDAAYPPAFLYEPMITLTWAAAATQRVGLGTSVL